MATPQNNSLYLARGYSLHRGVLPNTSQHMHGAIALLVSEARPFTLKFLDRSRLVCQSALIDAGVTHELITNGEPISVCYLESHNAFARKVRQFYFTNSKAYSPTVIMDPVSSTLEKSLVHKRLTEGSFDTVLGHPFSLSSEKGDLRILESLKELEDSPALALSSNSDIQRYLANKHEVSISRIRHLFKDELGVSFQFYKQWFQVRKFMRTFSLQFPSITEHALEHGFFDSSHFTNTYKKMVGLTPSSVIKPLEQVHLAR